MCTYCDVEHTRREALSLTRHVSLEEKLKRLDTYTKVTCLHNNTSCPGKTVNMFDNGVVMASVFRRKEKLRLGENTNVNPDWL